jgi:hypothetical protein
MPTNENDNIDDYTNARMTLWDKIFIGIKENKWYIMVGIAGIIVANYFGLINLPNLQFKHYFWALSAFSGYALLGTRMMSLMSDYIRDRRVQVALTPPHMDVLELIGIPRKTFSQYVNQGGELTDRTRLDGTKVLTVRGIDFIRKKLQPASEVPNDDRYPDDIDLIGEDADKQQIQKYRNAMIEDVQELHRRTVDEEVIKETAMSDAVDLFASALMDVRDKDIDLNQMDEKQIEVQAEQAIQTMAEQQPEDGNGGDGQ